MALEELTKLNRRFGEHIGGSVLELPLDLETRLGRAQRFVNGFKKKSKRAVSLRESLERQREIIEIIQEATEGGFALTSMELYGVLALRYGIKKKDLFPYAKSISTMAARGFLPTEGSSSLRISLKKDLVALILDVIKKSSEPMIYLDIGERLKYTIADKYSKERIGVSLNLLEIISAVVKLPVHSGIAGHPAVWLNPDLRETPKSIPYWNLKYLVLLYLAEHTDATQSDLAYDKRISELVSTRGMGGYRGSSVKRAIDDLLQFRLISCRKENRGKRGCIVYSIYPKAKQMVNLTENQCYLDEKLRRLLHGEKYIGLISLEKVKTSLDEDVFDSIPLDRIVNILGKEYVCLLHSDPLIEALTQDYDALLPTEQITLDNKVRRVGRILGSREEGETYFKLAPRISENTAYVRDILNRERDPLRDINGSTLLSVYFPHLDEVEKRGIQIYLNQRDMK